MSSLNILVLAGTHGNEINAPWLLSNMTNYHDLIISHGFNICTAIGNPLALEKGIRYLDRDLNRSFTPKLINSSNKDYEIQRARELINQYGPQSNRPCQIAIDLHSTTSAMGNCLVIYGRRPADLALASMIQLKLGLPIYLHEGDQTQTGFLVESWPCGLVIEVGPVPQGILRYEIVKQTQIALQSCLDELFHLKHEKAKFPENLEVHIHLGSLDFPRDSSGKINACISPSREGMDWIEIVKGEPLFAFPDGKTIDYEDDINSIPVFINEAAYAEKGIAMSLTKKEVWEFSSEWRDSLLDLIE